MYSLSKAHYLLHLGAPDPLKDMRSTVLNCENPNRTHEDEKDVVLEKVGVCNMRAEIRQDVALCDFS